MDLFLERGKEVFRQVHWNRLRKENKQTVQDAARALGLSVEEFPCKLLRPAEMTSEGQASTYTGNGTEVVDVIEEEQIENSVEHGTGTVEIANALESVVLNVGVNELDATVENSRIELKHFCFLELY